MRGGESPHLNWGADCGMEEDGAWGTPMIQAAAGADGSNFQFRLTSLALNGPAT